MDWYKLKKNGDELLVRRVPSKSKRSWFVEDQEGNRFRVNPDKLVLKK